ncbi:hypothetical protein [Dactylosporangium salmoneum]|uniref:Uncharacterized protein n=1 Tax=Dactylosporangium salmoneum TaxID=53361 RepID=A0ABP5U1T9_9ACTN
MKKLVWSSLAALLLLVGLTPAPASAAAAGYVEKCSLAANKKSLSLPGKTDITVHADTCIAHNGPYLYATLKFSWWANSDFPVGSGHKFDAFYIVSTLERRPNGVAADTIITDKNCDITTRINASWSGYLECTTSSYSGYSSAYDWSGDGWFRYDIDNDGASFAVFDLTGSPLIT